MFTVDIDFRPLARPVGTVPLRAQPLRSRNWRLVRAEKETGMLPPTPGFKERDSEVSWVRAPRPLGMLPLSPKFRLMLRNLRVAMKGNLNEGQ